MTDVRDMLCLSKFDGKPFNLTHWQLIVAAGNVRVPLRKSWWRF